MPFVKAKEVGTFILKNNFLQIKTNYILLDRPIKTHLITPQQEEKKTFLLQKLEFLDPIPFLWIPLLPL